MARIRTVKPAFFRHLDLYEAEKETGMPLRVAFAGLWTSADREGRFKWKPRELKLDCLPYDEIDFSRVLDALATRGFIVKYTVNGAEYGFVPTWKSHQAINNREAASELPQPTDSNTVSTRQARVDDASASPLMQDTGEGKGREGKGREDSEAKASAQSGAFEVTEASVYQFGKQLMGKGGGGQVTKLRKMFRDDWQKINSILLQAEAKGGAGAWIAGVLKGSESYEPTAEEICPASIYENVL